MWRVEISILGDYEAFNVAYYDRAAQSTINLGACDKDAADELCEYLNNLMEGGHLFPPYVTQS